MGAHELFLKGSEAFQRKDYETARTTFYEALNAADLPAGFDDEIWYNIAVSELHLGNAEAADAAMANAPALAARYQEIRQRYGVARSWWLHGDSAYEEGNFEWAAQCFEQALFGEDLEAEHRSAIYHHLAMALLQLGEWGRAEEAEAASGGGWAAQYNQQRARLQQASGIQSVTDGSGIDDTFSAARQRYLDGDYGGALALLDLITDASTAVPGFAEEVRLYRAMALLQSSRTREADELASGLTGPWRDSFDDLRTQLSPELGDY